MGSSIIPWERNITRNFSKTLSTSIFSWWTAHLRKGMIIFKCRNSYAAWMRFSNIQYKLLRENNLHTTCLSVPFMTFNFIHKNARNTAYEHIFNFTSVLLYFEHYVIVHNLQLAHYVLWFSWGYFPPDSWNNAFDCAWPNELHFIGG